VDVLPFVFIAKNDTDESVSEGFGKTWADNTGGSGAIKLYLKEIVQLATANISSARWATRQTCALALAGAATTIGHDTNALQLEILWPAMVTAASGRSWKGKGKVVEALVALAVNTKSHVNQDAKKLKEIEQVSTPAINYWLQRTTDGPHRS
jgi:proteasome component ECM29